MCVAWPRRLHRLNHALHMDERTALIMGRCAEAKHRDKLEIAHVVSHGPRPDLKSIGLGRASTINLSLSIGAVSPFSSM